MINAKRKRRIDIEELNKYAKEGLSVKKISDIFKVNKASVFKALEKHKIDYKKVNEKFPIWTKEELKIIQNYYEYTTIDILSKKLKRRTKSSIRRKAFELGIKKKILSPQCTPRSNLEVLLEDTVEAFYWIGFILADGWVSIKPKNTCALGISLSRKDKEHLFKYSNFISNLNPIREVESKGGIIRGQQLKTSKCKSIVSCNHKVVPLIMDKFDINTSKTYNPPSIKHYREFKGNLLTALFIGFIDGDGYITSKKRSYMIRSETYCTWEPFLRFIIINICKYLSIKNEPSFRLRKDRPKILISCLCGKDSIKKLKQFTIDNNLPVLERKWSKINY